jgi:hypothetical protein
VRGRAAYEKFLEEGGRAIVARPDCSILIKHEAFCDRGKPKLGSAVPCVCIPVYDIMTGQGMEPETV